MSEVVPLFPLHIFKVWAGIICLLPCALTMDANAKYNKSVKHFQM